MTRATSTYQTSDFALLPSIQFLCVLRRKPRLTSGPFGTITIELHEQDLALFAALKKSKSEINAALKLFRKRGKGKAAAEAEDEAEDDP